MPRTRRTPEAQAAHYAVKAAEVTCSADRKWVEAIMDAHPQTTTLARAHLQSLGLGLPAAADNEEKPTDVLRASFQKAKPARANSRGASTASLGAGDVIDPSDVVPSTYWRLNQLSKHKLGEKVISQMGEPSLSMANLRAHVYPLGAQASQHVMVELFCFMTGLPDVFPLTQSMRCFSNLVALGRSRAKDRGRRAMALALPPDWERDGLYRMCKAGAGDGDSEGGEGIEVHYRWGSKTVQLTRAQLPPHTGFGDLQLQANWSEQLANICNRQDGSKGPTLLLQPFFLEVFESLKVEPEGQEEQEEQELKKLRRSGASVKDEDHGAQGHVGMAKEEGLQEAKEEPKEADPWRRLQELGEETEGEGETPLEPEECHAPSSPIVDENAGCEDSDDDIGAEPEVMCSNEQEQQPMSSQDSQGCATFFQDQARMLEGGLVAPKGEAAGDA